MRISGCDKSSRNSVEPEWILAELPRSSYLEDTRHAGKSSALRTSPLSLVYKEWTWEHYRKLNVTFFTLSIGRSMGVFIGRLSRCFGRNLGSGGGGSCQASWLARVAGWPSFVAALILGIGYPVHWPPLTCWQSRIWKSANTWPADQGGGAGRPHFGLVGPRFCATSCPHVLFFVTMPYFGHIKDMHGFWSIWCFSVIQCS
jgi:hypothetical protein